MRANDDSHRHHANTSAYSRRFFIIMDIPKEDFADCFAKWKDMSH